MLDVNLQGDPFDTECIPKEHLFIALGHSETQ